MTLSASEVNQLKHAPAQENVLPVIRHRWSPRSFADRDVSPADLKTVFEAARWAASSYNEQPWRFLVGMRNSETYKKILSILIEFNQQWARTAPVLILDLTRTTFTQSGKPNPVALYDVGAAGGHPLLPGDRSRAVHAPDGGLRPGRSAQGLQRSRRLYLRRGDRPRLPGRTGRPDQRADAGPGDCPASAQAAQRTCLVGMGRTGKAGLIYTLILPLFCRR